MATSSSTRSPTRCSGRPGWAISAGSSRPTRGRRAGSPARSCSPRSSVGSAAAGWRPAADRPDDRRRPAAAGRPPRRRCATRSRRLLGLDRRRRQRQGVERQPRRLRGRRSRRSRRSSWRRWRRRRDDPAARHAVGRDPAARPAARRPDRHLFVRPDRLRAGPHRQLPLVPVRRPAGPLPALARRRR